MEMEEEKAVTDETILVMVPPYPLIKHWSSILRNEQTSPTIFARDLFPSSIAEELLHSEIFKGEVSSHLLSTDMTKLKKVNVVIDNSLSPSQTLLQIHCIDQKGLLYIILRTLKDCSIQQGAPVGKPKEPLEALFPKLQPTSNQQVRSRRSAYASSNPEDGVNGSPKDMNTS